MIYWLNLNKDNSNLPPNDMSLGSGSLQAGIVVIAGRMKYKSFIEKVKMLKKEYYILGKGDVYLAWGKGSYTDNWTNKSAGIFDGPLKQAGPLDNYGRETAAALSAAGAGIAAKVIVEAVTKSWYAFVITAFGQYAKPEKMFKNQRGAGKLGFYQSTFQSPMPFCNLPLMPKVPKVGEQFKKGVLGIGDAMDVVSFFTGD